MSPEPLAYSGGMFRRAVAIGMCGTVALLLLSGRPTALLANQKPSVPALLDLAGRYVVAFVERFSRVVAEEHYVQDWKTTSGIRLMHRESKSDFLLARVSTTDDWMAFRDVFEVNGTLVRDREERLSRLFVESSQGARDQLNAITLESARYNISNVQRTFNHPLFVFIFLQPDFQRRFTYSVDRLDRDLGPNAWAVEYRETARPTLIRGTGNKDLPARGRVWIDAVTGAVLKTELQLEDNLQATTISAIFRKDDRFSAPNDRIEFLAPAGMEEQYSLKGNAGKITATASYARFRRFEVDTHEQIR
jgi:hypothetical protein